MIVPRSTRIAASPHYRHLLCITLFIALLATATIGHDYYLVLHEPGVHDTFRSIPAWTRTDTPMPHAATVAAEDIRLPGYAALCRTLIVDLTLLVSRASGVDRAQSPSEMVLWIFPDAAMDGPFNVSRAEQHVVFGTPSDGPWGVRLDGREAPPGGGDSAYYIQRYRFEVSNLTLHGGQTYWVAVAASVARNYNGSIDYTQNQVRWMLRKQGATGADVNAPVQGGTSNNTNVSSKHPYRVVDRHGSMFRQAPFLVNWTEGALAEPYILDFPAGPSPRPSDATSISSHELEFAAYATHCMNLTQIPEHVYRSVLPETYPLRYPPAASPTFETSSSTVVESTPSTVSSTTATTNSSDAVVPSDSEEVPSHVVIIIATPSYSDGDDNSSDIIINVSTSLPPHDLEPLPSSSSSSPSPSWLISPTPYNGNVDVDDNTSDVIVPSSDSSGNDANATQSNNVSNVSSTSSKATRFSFTFIILNIVGGLVLILVIGISTLVLVRRFCWRRFTQMRYDELETEYGDTELEDRTIHVDIDDDSEEEADDDDDDDSKSGSVSARIPGKTYNNSSSDRGFQEISEAEVEAAMRTLQQNRIIMGASSNLEDDYDRNVMLEVPLDS